MSDYDLLIEPQVHDARKQLSGNVRQQSKRAIVIAVLGFNFLGDGLRDALDPRLRE